jgi:hypothetical protein
MKTTYPILSINIQSGWWLIVLVGFVLFSYGCSKTENQYNFTGKWICDYHQEYQGELEFGSDTYKLFITYQFQDTISGTIDESGSYNFTSNYSEPELFSGGHYYGTITFNPGNRTYVVSYSNGSDESFSFSRFKMGSKITVANMWWSRKNK